MANESNYEEVAGEVSRMLKGAIANFESRGNVRAPGLKATDLTPFKKELDRVQASRKEGNETIDAERTRTNNANAELQSGIKSRGAAEASGEFANQEVAQRNADIQANVNKIFGIDPDAIAITARRANEERLKGEAMLREIQTMQSVSFTDNPLEFIFNQVNLPAKIEPYNRQADIVEQLEASVKDGLAFASSAGTLQTKAQPSITVAQATAKADEAKAKASIEAAKAAENLAQVNVNFATQKLANDLNVASKTLQMTDLEMKENHQQYQAAVNAINVADNHTNRLIKAAELMEMLQRNEDKTKDRKATETMLANFDRITGREVGTTTIYSFDKMPAEMKKNILAMGAGSFGADPFSAVANLISAGTGPKLSPETAGLFRWLHDKASGIAGGPDVQRLDEKQKPMVINKRLMETVQAEIAGASNPGNIFHELTPAAMIASGHVKADSKLGKVLQPFIDSQDAGNPQVITAAIIQEFKNPVEAGAVIADYYKRNMILRNTSMSAAAAGITLPESYKIRGTDGVFSTATYDLTRPEEATKYALKLIITKREAEGRQGTGAR